MKKIIKLCLLSMIIFLGVSCASTPINHGYYPTELTESDAVVKVIVDKNIEITGIDDTSSNYAGGVPGWKQKTSPSQKQEFYVKPGIHTFSVKFDSGNQYVVFSKVLVALLEEGYDYQITYYISGSTVDYDIVNLQNLESVQLDQETLAGNTQNKMSNFISAVLNPTMEGSDQTVIEENDEYILKSLPEMKYELFNKKTSEAERGYRGFVTDFTFKKGTVYLYATDEFANKDEFLDSDYEKEAQTVLEVYDCDKKTVTFTYVKPESKKGEKITFNISVE